MFNCILLGLWLLLNGYYITVFWEVLKLTVHFVLHLLICMGQLQGNRSTIKYASDSKDSQCIQCHGCTTSTLRTFCDVHVRQLSRRTVAESLTPGRAGENK